MQDASKQVSRDNKWKKKKYREWKNCIQRYHIFRMLSLDNIGV